MDTNRRSTVLASEVAATRPQSETFDSFVRFLGDIPFTPSDEFFELMQLAERRCVMWISRLDEKKRSDGWMLEKVVRDKTCLTMGPLEGSLEWHLNNLGAGQIVAIEGNRDNVLKCRVLKAAFPELRAEFIHGDVMDTAFPESDLAFCPGVLYHLAEPHIVLQKIYEMRPKLAFLSTQLAVTPEHPASVFRKLTSDAQLSHREKLYRGRHFNEGPSNYLAGMDRTKPSIWLYPDELSRLLADIGFHSEDAFVADLGQLGVVGSYVCSVQGHAAPIRYRLPAAARLRRRFFAGIAKRISPQHLTRKSALRG
jgi:hypothetical protein